MVDIASDGMRESECDVCLVAIDDHRDEQAVQGIPQRRLYRQGRKCEANARAMLGYVAGIEAQALRADVNRRAGVHALERLLCAVRVCAEFGVKLIDDLQNQQRSGGEALRLAARFGNYAAAAF